MAAENLSSHRYKNARLSPGLHLQFSLSFLKSLSQSVSWQELNRGLDLTGSLLMVTKAASNVSGACYKCLVSNLDLSVFAECMAFKYLRSRSQSEEDTSVCSESKLCLHSVDGWGESFKCTFLGVVGRGPDYGLPAFVTWRSGSGVTGTSTLFIRPDITHVCVCVWSAVITVYATCRIPEAWGGGMRAFVHLWAAFQNSFISIISPPALRVSWHICRDYTPRFLALVSSKTPGFFLLRVEGEAWGSAGSASSIWILQRHFSKCAGKTYAGSYFPRVGNIAKSTLFHSFLCSIWFRIRVYVFPCVKTYGGREGRAS